MAEGKSCASVNSEYLGASELVEMYQKAYRDALITAAQLEQRLDPCGISQLQGQPYTRAYLAMVLNLPPNADEKTVSRMARSSPVAGILEKNFPIFFSKKKAGSGHTTTTGGLRRFGGGRRRRQAVPRAPVRVTGGWLGLEMPSWVLPDHPVSALRSATLRLRMLRDHERIRLMSLKQLDRLISEAAALSLSFKSTPIQKAVYKRYSRLARSLRKH